MFESKKIKLAMACSALISVMALTACDNNTTTNSSPIIENPTTSVSGRVTDTVTGEPIKNAVVMIEGLNITARTDADGNYTLRNVPPNNSGAGTGLGSYRITLDMKGVTSPVAMSDSTITNRYADMDVTGNTMNVQASAFNDAGGAGGGTSVGETGITNVVNLNVGKASGTISGTVFDMDGSTLVAGARVELWQGAENVAVTTSDATAGTFSFAGVEAGFAYTVMIFKDDMTDTSAIPTMSENQTYSVDVDQRIVLAYTDVTAPVIVDAPDAGMDKASDADASFSWVLNEAVAADPMGYRDSIAVGGNLFNDISVTYDGAKAGGVAKTVAWNADFTILTVTIPAASLRATSAYTITMADVSNTAGGGSTMQLMDAANNAVANASFANRSFTTNGGVDLSATAPVVTIAAPRGTFTHNETTVNLDWAPVPGASSYNVYRDTTIGGVNLGSVMIGTATTSNYSDDLTAAAAHGDNGGAGNLSTPEREGISHTYSVAAVNSNKVEGMMSTATTAISDTTDPIVNAGACNAGASIYELSDGSANGDTISLTFSEPMNIATLEVLGSYTNLPAGAKTISSNGTGTTVTVSYDTAVCPSTGVVLTAGTSITDIAGRALTVAAGNATGNTHTLP